MLKDILNWLCGIGPEIKTGLSIEVGEEKVRSYSIPGCKYIVIDLSDLRKVVYSFGKSSSYKRKIIIKEIIKTMNPGTEIVLSSKEDLDIFLGLGCSIKNFETQSILKL